MNSKHLLFFSLLLLIVNSKVHGSRVIDVNGVLTILALDGEDVNIECKNDIAMSYCGFVHPNGTRYSFLGADLINGHCSIKTKATKRDSGEWRCHIGKQVIGVEILKKIQLRVVNEVAAVQRNITAVHGKEVTLFCTTTKGLTPMRYCRFEPPKGSAFSINPSVNSKNPILGKYYFPQNKSLDRGDCAVTIRKVKYEDVGAWTCGAALDDDKEYTDVIDLQVEGFYTMSTASASGITFGAVGIAVFLAILGIIAWKKRSVLGSREEQQEVIEIQELGEGRIQRSPQARRHIPSVVIQAPSEPSTSPLM